MNVVEGQKKKKKNKSVRVSGGSLERVQTTFSVFEVTWMEMSAIEVVLWQQFDPIGCQEILLEIEKAKACLLFGSLAQHPVEVLDRCSMIKVVSFPLCLEQDRDDDLKGVGRKKERKKKTLFR